jgi:hypothetical protein
MKNINNMIFNKFLIILIFIFSFIVKLYNIIEFNKISFINLILNVLKLLIFLYLNHFILNLNLKILYIVLNKLILMDINIIKTFFKHHVNI